MISNSINAPLAPAHWTSLRAPDTIDLIFSISKAIYMEIQSFYENIIITRGVINLENIPDSDYFSFKENLGNSSNEKPLWPVNIEEISEFIQTLYKEFKFGVECFIVTMAYIKKFLVHSKIPMMRENWKVILLMSTLIAQRVSDNALISASDYKRIPGFCLDDIRLMEIEYLNLIAYDYKLEANDYLNQVNYLRDISKSSRGDSWLLDNEKLENIIKRSKWLSEEESDDDCGIYHSEAMYSIEWEETDY